MKSKIIIFFLLSAGMFGCKTQQSLPTYYYDFSKKKLTTDEAGNKPQDRPIPYQAEKDIQITIHNYNPLKDEISTEFSSTERFTQDASQISNFIVFPKMADVATNTEAAKADAQKKEVAPLFKARSGGKSKLVKVETITAIPAPTNCNQLETYLNEFDTKKHSITAKIDEYKLLMTRFDLIKDVYTYLQKVPVLSSAVINSAAKDNFLTRLNDILPAADQTGTDISAIGQTVFSTLELKYYNKITESEIDLNSLKTKVDALKDDKCDGYGTLLKKFTDAYTELKSNLKDLKTAHTDKILPAFNKNLEVYSELKQYAGNIPIFVTEATTIDKDAHTIKIYNKELGKTSKALYDNINIVANHGWKVDVATGFFFSGLHDESYSKKSMDSIHTTQYVQDGHVRDTTIQENFTAIYKKDQSPISFGGMFYLNAHTQNDQMLNYGFYLGFGALFNDQTRWAGSGGASLLIGKRQRFNIHAGIIVAQVERLSPPYKTEKWYREAIDNIPTYKKWNYSYVVGFSWNLK